MRTRLIVAAILGMSVYGFAQFGGRRAGGFGGQRPCLVPGYSGSGEEDTSAPRKIDRSGFVYARVRYHIQPWWRQAGNREVPWHHDYPDGDTMFPTSLQRLTRVYT